MSIDESFFEKVRALPPEKQREVISLVEYLHKKSSSASPKRSLAGLWADLKVDVSPEDIEDVRSEMWGKFPRKDL